MSVPIMKGGASMDRKRITISAKRQITIPQKFFEMLGFDGEAECIVRGKELVIRPIKEIIGGEFAEQILADLIAQGFEGEELLAQFRATQKKIRPAIETILNEAKHVADGNGKYSTYDEIFESEE